MGWLSKLLTPNKLKAPQGSSGVSEVPMLGPYLKYCSTTGNQSSPTPNTGPLIFHRSLDLFFFFYTLKFNWQWSDGESVEDLNSLGFVYVHISCWKYISVVCFGLGFYVLICVFGSQVLTCWTQLCNWS